MDSHSSGFDLDPNAGLTNPQRGAYRTEVPPTTPSRARRALPVALDGLSVGSPAGMIPCTGSRILLRNGVLYIEGGEFSNIARLVEIGRQHAEGRTGGGPPCSWCGERELMHLENSDVWQCRSCHAGSRIRVTVNGLGVERVLSDRERAARPRVIRYPKPPVYAMYCPDASTDMVRCP